MTEIGKEYGKALFMLSEELGNTEDVLADLTAVAEVFEQNPAYPKLLDTPAVSKSEKLALVSEAFLSVEESVVNLIKILCEKHSVHAFCDVSKNFRALYNEARGIENVEAVSAVAMSEEQITRLADRLGERTGKTVLIKNTVDSGVLGGIKLRYGGTQLDGTVRASLDRFERMLEGSAI